MSDTSPFRSPLAVTQPSRWTAIDFGSITTTPAIEQLADELEAEIWRIAALMPPPLAEEAARVIGGYPGPGRRFINLFYRPVWSVLHWLEPDTAMRAPAVRVHALALMLHLWDDHLCDGQLPPDIVRLHFRSIAWQEMQTAMRPDDAISDTLATLASTYLEAIHAPQPVTSLEVHLARFERQIALWHAAPRMLAMRRDKHVAAQVDAALVQFCLAWRLIDDIQDIAEDRATGQDNGVRLVLTGSAAATWDAARCAPLPESADAALSDAVETILKRAREALRLAQSHAADAGLDDWASEMDQAQDF